MIGGRFKVGVTGTQTGTSFLNGGQVRESRREWRRFPHASASHHEALTPSP